MQIGLPLVVRAIGAVQLFVWCLLIMMTFGVVDSSLWVVLVATPLCALTRMVLERLQNMGMWIVAGPIRTDLLLRTPCAL